MTNDEARKVLQELWKNEREDYCSLEVREAIDRAIRELKRPTGYWIITNRKYELKDKDNTFVGMYHKCSKCGFDEARGGTFCLNCGADMRSDHQTMQ